MTELDLDRWSNAVTLFLLGIGFLWLMVVLIRRTKRWNGVGRAMTLLTGILGLLYLQGSWNWLVRIEEDIPSLPIPVRVATRVLAIVAVVYAIYKVSTVELVAIKPPSED